jgi:hypothetical protein
MRLVFPLLLVLIACEPSRSSAHLAGYAERLLMVDVATCRAPDGASAAHWTGAAWAFTAPGALRCPLALEWQDVVTGFEVYGGHGAGAIATTACLNVCEPMTPGAPCGEAHPCAAPVDGTDGVLWLSATGISAGFSEDLNGHVAINGVTGDSVAGLIFYVQRL